MRKYKLTEKWSHNEKGQWLDASGDVITEERVMRHIPSIKVSILAHFPKGYCKNSREEFGALVNNGIEEVYRSLTLFSKHECLTKVNSGAKFKRMSDAARLEWKQTHQAEALLKGEHEWVKRALMRFYWRYRLDEGKKKQIYEEIPTDFQSMHGSCYGSDNESNSFDIDYGADVIPMRDIGSGHSPMLGIDTKQAVIDSEMLNDIRETEGDEAVHQHFKLMSPERQENLTEFLLVRKSENETADSHAEFVRRHHIESNEEAQQENESQEESDETINAEGDAE